MLLVNGPLVVEDQLNNFKSVIFYNGLLKRSNMCGMELIANVGNNGVPMVEGLIYRFNSDKL
jgi:hypothetical protein